LGVLRFDLVEDRLKDEAAALVEELPQVFLEVECGCGGDRPTEKAGSQRGDPLAQDKAGLGGAVEDGLKLLDKSAGQAEGENASAASLKQSCIRRRLSPVAGFSPV